MVAESFLGMLFIASARYWTKFAYAAREAKMTRMNGVVLVLFAIVPLAAASGASAQIPPNPYRLVENWAQIPINMNGGKWGEVIGVKPGPDGSISLWETFSGATPPGTTWSGS